MQASLYKHNQPLVRPGHPGRYVFSHVVPGFVVLRHLSANNRKFGQVKVPADTYESTYTIPLDPHQRATLRGKLLKTIHNGDPEPDSGTPAQLAAATKWLKAQQLIEPGPDGTYRTTAEGAKYVKDKSDE